MKNSVKALKWLCFILKIVIFLVLFAPFLKYKCKGVMENMNIGLKTAMIQDLEKLNYEVSHYDKKIMDTIVILYEQIKDCDKELKKEGLIIVVDEKVKANPRMDVKLKLLSTLKSYLGMFPLDIKTKMTILIENEIDEEVYGADESFAESLVLEM